MNGSNKSILILAAMKVEAEYIFKSIQQIHKQSIDGYDYYIGKINEINVVLGITGIMSSRALLATYIGIKHFQPSFIVLEGSAGGYVEDLHVNDIVIGIKSVDISRVITPVKEKGMGSNSIEWKLVEFDENADDFLSNVKYEYGSESLINSISNVNYCHGKVIQGIVGSGNVWNNEIDRIHFFNQNYGIVCEEMETYAVYEVCRQYNIPVISIRVISNNIVTKEEFNHDSMKYLQEYVVDWILQL